MKRKRKAICLMISALMLMNSTLPVYAQESVDNNQESEVVKDENMENPQKKIGEGVEATNPDVAKALSEADVVLSYMNADKGTGKGQFAEESVNALITARETFAAESSKEGADVNALITELNKSMETALNSNKNENEELTVAVQRSFVKAASSGFYNDSDSYSNEKAMDGDPATFWHSKNKTGSWFEMDFGAKRLFDRVTIQQRSDNSGAGLVPGVKIYAGTSKEDAVLIKEFTGKGAAVGLGGVLDIEVPYIWASYIRIEPITTNYAAIAEANVYVYERSANEAYAAYQEAQKEAEKAVVGEGVGEYPNQEIIDEFKAYMETIRESFVTETTTNSQGYVFADEIKRKTSEFTAKAKSFTKEELLVKITEAKELHGRLENEEDKNKLWEIIMQAEGVYNSPSPSAEELENAIKMLENAIEVFAFANESEIDLSGQWGFKLGGYETETITPEKLEETVTLPGTLDTNKKGTATNPNVPNEKRLSRKYTYKGVATFQRDIFIPTSYEGKYITLSMERTRVTRMWINGKEVTDANRNALAVANVYNISEAVKAGEMNTVTITVDNSYTTLGDGVADAVLGSHMATEETQTNWNGILGEFKVEARENVAIDVLKVLPNDDLKSVKVELSLRNTGSEKFVGKVTLKVGELEEEVEVEVPAGESKTITIDEFSMGKSPKLWDEFTPENRYTMTAELSNGDKKTEEFGIRKFEVDSESFKLKNNGRKVFLRSEANCAVFPLTGYAPMDKESWETLFETYKSYGVNAVRFHSWCPPEAAFEVADEKGMFLWVEMSHWTGKKTTKNIEYIEKEAKAVLNAFGNHPSLVILGYCNEPNNSLDKLNAITPRLRKIDDTRCYFIGSSPAGNKPPSSNCDIFANGSFRGSASGNRGFVYKELPTSSYNHNEVVGGLIQKEKESNTDADTAFIGHEVGQYQVFPNYNHEIEEYTGVLVPRNLEHWRGLTVNAGLEDKIDEYVKNSGMVSRLCYRLEIEAALRTDGQGGVSLLGLQDFPGQGTALVGMMDALGHPKHNDEGVYEFADPTGYKQFFDAVVPMMEMESFTWKNNQSLTGELIITNYGQGDITSDVTISLKKKDTGEVVKEIKVPNCELKQGEINRLGTQSMELASIREATALELAITVDSIGKTNSYDVWVYAADNLADPGSVYIAESLNSDVMERLQNGEKVLLMPEATEKNFPKSTDGVFPTNFWAGSQYINWGGGGGAGTMGIMVDPEHKVFEQFPTESYSGFQWGSIAMNGRPMKLNNAPEGLEPLVTVMDDYAAPDLMGTLIEAKVGNGKLMICSMGLNQIERTAPEARQMKRSILAYMNSEEFNPTIEMTEDYLKTIVAETDGEDTENNVALDKNAGKFNSDFMKPGNRPEKINDGNLDVSSGRTCWNDYNSKPEDQAKYYTIPLKAEFSFDESTIHKVVLYLHEDEGGGVCLPKEIKLEYWDGEKYVSVENQSQITGFKAGENTITFKDVSTTKLRAVMEHKKTENAAIAVAEMEIYRRPVFAESIQIVSENGKGAVKVGEKLQLNAVITPSAIKNPEILWGIQDEGYPESPAVRGKIDENGLFVGEKEGNVVITATYVKNPQITVDYVVSVGPAEAKYTLGTEVEGKGRVTPDTAYVNPETEVDFTFIPEEGMELHKLLLGKEEISLDKVKDGKITLKGISEDTTLKAVFGEKKPIEQEVAVEAVTKLDNKQVSLGTLYEALGLPEKVEVTLADGTTKELGVTWEKGDYNSEAEGTYKLYGSLRLEEGIINSKDLKAEIDVIVQGEEGQEVKKDELQKRYDEFKKVTQGQYTDKSWKVFQDALRKAKRILQDETATQEEVNQILDELNEAYKGLEKVEDSKNPSDKNDKNDQMTQTGDNAPIAVMVIGMVAALAVMLVILFGRKYSKK